MTGNMTKNMGDWEVDKIGVHDVKSPKFLIKKFFKNQCRKKNVLINKYSRADKMTQ